MVVAVARLLGKGATANLLALALVRRAKRPPVVLAAGCICGEEDSTSTVSFVLRDCAGRSESVAAEAVWSSALVDGAGARTALCDAIGCCWDESAAELSFALPATAPKATPLICGSDGFATLRVSVFCLFVLPAWVEKSGAGGTAPGCGCGFSRVACEAMAVSKLFCFGSII